MYIMYVRWCFLNNVIFIPRKQFKKGFLGLKFLIMFFIIFAHFLEQIWVITKPFEFLCSFLIQSCAEVYHEKKLVISTISKWIWLISFNNLLDSSFFICSNSSSWPTCRHSLSLTFIREVSTYSVKSEQQLSLSLEINWLFKRFHLFKQIMNGSSHWNK